MKSDMKRKHEICTKRKCFEVKNTKYEIFYEKDEIKQEWWQYTRIRNEIDIKMNK